MAKQKVDNWIVLTGNIVFTCTTRKRARKYAKEHKINYPQYNYIGKCTNNFSKIVLDV